MSPTGNNFNREVVRHVRPLISVLETRSASQSKTWTPAANAPLNFRSAALLGFSIGCLGRRRRRRPCPWFCRWLRARTAQTLDGRRRVFHAYKPRREIEGRLLDFIRRRCVVSIDIFSNRLFGLSSVRATLFSPLLAEMTQERVGGIKAEQSQTLRSCAALT